MTRVRPHITLTEYSPKLIAGPKGSPGIDPDGTRERGEARTISPEENGYPFQPGDYLQFKTGGRSYRFLRDAPGQPRFIVCEFWEPAAYASIRLERVEVRLPVDIMMRLAGAGDSQR